VQKFATGKECWIISSVVQSWYRYYNEDLTAERLAEILAVLNREFKSRFGRPLIDMEFVVWLDGVYSAELLDALEQCADVGIVEYAVEVAPPFVPHTEEDLALLKDVFDEVDAKYVKRVVKPGIGAKAPPERGALLKSVGASEEELEKLVATALSTRLNPQGRKLGERIT